MIYSNFYYDNPQILAEESYWKSIDVDVARYCEERIITESDGLVYKEGGKLTAEFLSRRRKKDSLHFQQYVGREYIHFNDRKSPHNPVRLVWGGTITPSRYSKKICGDNQLIELFRLLILQGFDLTVFVTQPEENLKFFYSDYLKLGEKTKLFKLHGFTQRNTLLKTISQEYDYGIILGICEGDLRRNIGLKTTIASKIFTYIAAGIPILVSREFEAMADLIESNGIGKAYSTAELNNIYADVSLLPYTDYKNNLRNFAMKQALEERVEDLYNYIMNVLKGN